MNAKLHKLFLKAGIIGPIFYTLLLVLLGYLWPGYSPIRNYISELGGVESPFKLIMNVFGFMLLGVSLTLFSFGANATLSKNIYSRLVAAFTFLAGVFMVLVGFFPCDAGCVDVTLIGRLHTLTSVPPSILLPSAAMFSAFAIYTKSPNTRKYSILFFWLGVLSMLSGAVSTLPSLQVYIGLSQRAGMGFSLLWVVIASYYLLNVRADRS
jgi:hypothetical membrane protein